MTLRPLAAILIMLMWAGMALAVAYGGGIRAVYFDHPDPVPWILTAIAIASTAAAALNWRPRK